MTFNVVYTLNRKKLDKLCKNNKIRNKYVIDIQKMIEEDELDPNDKTYLKIVVFNKIQQAIEKDRNIYYIPIFDDEFSIEKLLNLRKILDNNEFNILVFYEDFKKMPKILDDIVCNLTKFDNSKILRNY